ncbi:cytochrome c oxidase subunit 3 [Oerskovia enterophila]|uniref:cytochrome-c oxidase n=3 Tax=Oerskovia TaxID=162491 RepID=A0A163T5V3_9CELL|nr:cytochrome c oxidase subunit 3 [Oerskovia enterophila]
MAQIAPTSAIMAGVSTATAAPHAHQHVSVNRPNPVSVGTIVWLASELMFFAGLFAMYFTARSVIPAEEWASQTEKLNIPFAVINTSVLVLSSVTCQLGVLAAERFQPVRTGSIFQVNRWGMNEWITLTYIMGSFFIGGQIYEYAELVHEGLTISSHPYGSVFFMATGFHGIHVVGGLIAFLFLLGRSFSAKNFGHHEATTGIVTSYYWHFVDVVWIALFFVIYILR